MGRVDQRTGPFDRTTPPNRSNGSQKALWWLSKGLPVHQTPENRVPLGRPRNPLMALADRLRSTHRLVLTAMCLVFPSFFPARKPTTEPNPMHHHFIHRQQERAPGPSPWEAPSFNRVNRDRIDRHRPASVASGAGKCAPPTAAGPPIYSKAAGPSMSAAHASNRIRRQGCRRRGLERRPPLGGRADTRSVSIRTSPGPTGAPASLGLRGRVGRGPAWARLARVD